MDRWTDGRTEGRMNKWKGQVFSRLEWVTRVTKEHRLYLISDLKD